MTLKEYPVMRLAGRAEMSKGQTYQLLRTSSRFWARIALLKTPMREDLRTMMLEMPFSFQLKCSGKMVQAYYHNTGC